MEEKDIPKFVQLQTTEELTLEELADRIGAMVDHDDAATFIAILEKTYESWEITEKLIKHFKHMEIVYNNEFPEDEREDLSPEALI